MRKGRRLVGGLLVGCVVAAGSGAGWGAAADPVGPLVGHRFVTIAYNRSRATKLTPKTAAEEAEMLLLMAQRAEPQSVHTAKLLVEAAVATGDKETLREALRTLVRLDPGDLVAQVQYIDYLASSAETINERSRIFQGALDATTLDPQIRSEMAVRLANIVRERGDAARAGQYVDQALSLNNVNLGALQARVAMAGNNAPEELKGLIALVKANPLMPEVWVEMARVMERAGLFDAASQFMNTAIEQSQAGGHAMPADLYLELALDLATAGRPVEARPILEAVAKLDDAPVSALVAAVLLDADHPAKGAASQAATQTADSLDSRIQAKLEASIKAQPKSAAALVDAVWVELSAMPEVGAETGGWMESLRKLLGADDPALVRLEGWNLLRQGKLDDARAVLEKAAPADPLAQLGLVRVLIAQHQMAAAQRAVQDLWWTHPTGVFAFQVAEAARATGGTGGASFKLAPTVSTQELSGVVATLPSSLVTAHRHVYDLELVTANFTKRNVQLEEAVPLRVRIANTTDRPMAVGPDGFFKTTIALTARTLGVDRANLGVYGIEELQRTYRLEPRAAIEGTVRVDQGAVAEYLATNPRQTFTLDISVITAPRGDLKDAKAGLGGQELPVGDFIRTGRQLGSGNDITALIEDLAKTSGAAQAVDVQMLSMGVNMLSDEVTQKASRVDEAPEATEARTNLRAQITKALVPMIESPSATMRAWTILNLPTVGLNELQGKLDASSEDPDPLVRIAWARWAGSVVLERGDGAPAALSALEKRLGAERDTVVHREIVAQLDDLKQMGATQETPPGP